MKIASFFVHVQNVLARYLPYYWWMRRQRGAREARILEVGNSLLASGFLVLIALWNLNQIRPNSVYLPRPVERFAHILRIDQRWAMFAPEPMRDDGWFVIVGALRGGASVDLLNRSSTSINWDKPRRVSSLYPDQRWRAYMVMLSREGKKYHFAALSLYYCRKWNRNIRYSDPLLRHLRIFFNSERTEGGRELRPVRSLVWQQKCR